MAPVFRRGFVVQNSVTPLDLRESLNQSPIIFITEERKYATASKANRLPLNKYLIESSSVVYWEYYDEDRRIFEDDIFKLYDHKIHRGSTDEARIRNYLKLYKMFSRCADVEEARRIFIQFSLVFEHFGISFISELMDIVCIYEDILLCIFDLAGSGNLNFLKGLLTLSKIQNQNSANLSIYSWDGITDLNIISRYFISGYYSSISVLLQHGLQWKYTESVYFDLCKRLNFNWTVEVLDPSNCDYEESAGRSKHRFFLILQTYLVINKDSENQESLKALHLLWRSIPDAVISRGEMITALKKFTGLGEESFQICKTAVWWENGHLPGARSLKHLSRCAVRQQLVRNYKLPYNDLGLEIPVTLIPYINLDE